MRKEMEALQKTSERASKSTTAPLSSGKGDIVGMKNIRDEVNTLMGQIVNMTSELQQVQQTKPNLLVDNQPLQRQPKLEQQASSEENAKDLDSNSVPFDSKEAAAKIAELERVQHVLRTQLQRAAHDVMRVANERDLLMEISNSLHADFNRSLQLEKIRESAPTTENHRFRSPSQNHSRSPEDGFHERRRKVASSSPRCSRTSPNRPSTCPSKSLLKSGGLEHSAPPKQVWMNGHGSVTDFRRDRENHQYKDSKYAYPNEVTEQERRLLLEGRMTPLRERSYLQQDFVHKGIPSQRSKLQASVKRREAQMASRVKVRNYNIKDEDTL